MLLTNWLSSTVAKLQTRRSGRRDRRSVWQRNAAIDLRSVTPPTVEVLEDRALLSVVGPEHLEPPSESDRLQESALVGASESYGRSMTPIEVPEGYRLKSIDPSILSPATANMTPSQFIIAEVGPNDPRLSPASDEVFLVSTAPHPSLLRLVESHNVDAADTANADQLYSGGGLGLDLSGDGLTVGVWEAGSGYVRDTHQEFGGRVTFGDSGGAFDNHATQVAGVIGAAGVDADARGMANEIEMVSYTSRFDTAEMDRDAHRYVASNHSYGDFNGWSVEDTGDFSFLPNVGNIDIWFGDRSSGTEVADFGKYTNSTRDLDRVLADNSHLLSVWSAGNDRNDQFLNVTTNDTYMTYLSSDPGNVTGYSDAGWYVVPNSGATAAAGSDGNNGTGFDSLSPAQTAKNSLVVGAVNDVTNDPYVSADVTTTSFSSYGPTDDGRIKPDVVANGAGLFSPSAGNDSEYDSVSGTSFSAPSVTGTAALLIEHYENLFGTRPDAATTRGLLTHTAFDAGNTGPDYSFGWGLVDAAAAATFLTSAAAPVPGVVLQSLTYAGSAVRLQVTTDGSTPLKTTVVWTDRAGTAQSNGSFEAPGGAIDAPTSVLVNDLDLTITGTGGPFLPWTLDPSNPADAATRDQANHVDNIEQVLIDNPAAGTYEIVVNHSGGAFVQDFAILVSGAVVSAASPVLSLPTILPVFDVGASETLVHSGLTVSDSDSSDFDTGVLTARIGDGATADDRLVIQNQGTGTGQVGVSGASVTFEGATVGTFSGGTNGSTPLDITFGASATAEIVEAVARAIGFDNVSATPFTNDRLIELSLTDGDGGTAISRVQKIQVGPLERRDTIEGLTIDQSAANTSGSAFIGGDTHGAVGNGHVVSVAGRSIEWHTKDGVQQNSQRLGLTNGSAAGSFFESLSPATSLGDARVLYDNFADRFLVVAREVVDNGSTGTSRILLAVSNDGDPNSVWRFHAINSNINIGGDETFALRPVIAVDEQALYITGEMFTFDGEDNSGTRLWIVDKGLAGGFYSGGAVGVTVHDAQTAAGAFDLDFVPATLFQNGPGTVGTWLVGYDGLSQDSATDSTGQEAVQIIRIDDPLGTPSFTSQLLFSGNIEHAGPNGPDLPTALQSGTTTNVTTGDRSIENAVWRDDELWFTTTIRPVSGADANQATVHWWNVDTSTPSSLSIADQGDVSGEDLGVVTHTFAPSITINDGGDVAIAFSASNADIFPGAYYTGRRSTDAAGTVRSTFALAEGTAPYVRTFSGSTNLWTNYSSIAFDPLDPDTFWTFNQYARTTGFVSNDPADNGRWGSRWGSFGFENAVTQSLVVSSMSVTVNEGGTNTFTVALNAEPTGTVTVDLAKISGDADLSISGSSQLTFDSGDWNVPKVFSLAAAQDADAVDGSAIFNVTSTGLTTVAVTATENDDDTQSLVVSSTSVTVDEGQTATFTVALSAEPTGTVTVDLAKISGDADLSISGGSQLTFDSGDWNVPKVFTLAAAQDADFADGTATFDVTSTGLATVTVTATENDDDTQSLVVSSTSVTVDEGQTTTFTVALSAEPTGTVTVDLAKISGDADLSISGGSQLTFDSGDWNVPKVFSLAAAQDADFADGTATFDVTSTGLATVTVTATENDDDTASNNVAPELLTSATPALPSIDEDTTNPAGTSVTSFIVTNSITDANVPASVVFQEGSSSFGGSGYTTGAVTIRQWGGSEFVDTNHNGAGVVIIGFNEPSGDGTSREQLRGLFEFDMVELVSQLGGQEFNVDSASVVLTRSTDGSRFNSGDNHLLMQLEAHAYDFDFDEQFATWDHPSAISGTATGSDTTAGGTVSTLLSNASFNVETSVASLPDITLADSPAFRDSVKGSVISDGVMRLLVKASDAIENEAQSSPSAYDSHFARFYAESTSTEADRPKLNLSLSAQKAIAVTGINEDSGGAWQYRLNGEGPWNSVGARTDATALLLGPNDEMRFLPFANYDGTPTFTFRAWDQTGGVVGETFNITTTGGTSAFSSDFDTASITVSNVNDVPTGTVTIDDITPSEDQLLTASNDLADADGLGTFTYTWERADNAAFTTNVATVGTNAATFTPGDTEVGKFLRVTITYTDGNGTAESVSSAVTSAVSNVNDVPTGTVTIDDITPSEDQLLTASNDLADADGLGTFTYTWERADNAAFTTNVATVGTYAATFTPGDAEVGKFLRATITYTDGNGTAESVSSAVTSAVTPVGDPLTVTVLSSSVSEAAGPSATTATVTRTGSTDAALTVTITNPDASELHLPATVEIPIGAYSVDFDIETVNDGDIDGDQTGLSIGVSAGSNSGSVLMDVLDDDTVSSRTLGGHLFEPIAADTYTVLHDINVDTGANLNIAAGSQLKFDSGVALNVAGVLTAVGSSGSEIVFTSSATTPAAGDWAGITITSVETTRTRVEHAQISFAETGVNIFPEGSHPQVSIEDSEIFENSQSGIHSFVGRSELISAGDVLIQNNLIRNNGGGITVASRSGLFLTGGAGAPSRNDTQIISNEILANTSAGITLSASSDPFNGINFPNASSTIASPIRGNLIKSNAIGIVGNASPGNFPPFGTNTTDLVILEATIENNVIVDSTSHGIELTSNSLASPRRVRPQIINNTIANNSGVGILHDADVDTSSFPFTIRNNVVAGNTGGIQADASFTPPAGLIGFNDVFANSGANWTNYPASFGDLTTTNANGTPADAEFNISVDPLFVSATDYHLTSASPAIDAGSNVGAPAFDFDEATRTPPVDIGAYEFFAPSFVAGRHIFYSGSTFFDANGTVIDTDPAGGFDETTAIATNKQALLLGGTATLANYTSYIHGINGIMVDIGNLPGTPTAADFDFKVGFDGGLSGFVPAPAPSDVKVQAGAGANGSDRVVITWANQAIKKTWLQVTVLATANTGLVTPDTHYWGNWAGETNGSGVGTRPQVNVFDQLLVRGNSTQSGVTTTVVDPYDINRDGLVNVFDQLLVRGNSTNLSTPDNRGLLLGTAPSSAAIFGARAFGLLDKLLSADVDDDDDLFLGEI